MGKCEKHVFMYFNDGVQFNDTEKC